MAIALLARASRFAIHRGPTSPGSRPLLGRILFMVMVSIVYAAVPQLPAAASGPAPVSAASASGYLHTDGAQLQDASGDEVRLTGINWFGLATCAFAPPGL